MMFPTQKATDFAEGLRDRVVRREMDSQTSTDPVEVAQATIHARQDMILLFAMQIRAHEQLVKISRGVWFVGFAILMVAMGLGER